MIKRLYLETRATTSSSRLARITLTTRNSTTTTSIINRIHAIFCLNVQNIVGLLLFL
jgi:hypothetical protein